MTKTAAKKVKGVLRISTKKKGVLRQRKRGLVGQLKSTEKDADVLKKWLSGDKEGKENRIVKEGPGRGSFLVRLMSRRSGWQRVSSRVRKARADEGRGNGVF